MLSWIGCGATAVGRAAARSSRVVRARNGAAPRHALQGSTCPSLLSRRPNEPIAPGTGAARGFSSAPSSAVGSPDAPTPEALARIRALSDNVTKNVEAGVAELKAAYGPAHAEKIWMSEYYRHGDARFFVPAVAVLARDPALQAAPSLAAKSAVFAAAVFRGLPAETQAQAAATLALLAGMDIAFILAVMHQSGTPAGRSMFERLGISMRRSGAAGLVAMGQHVGSVPTGVPPQDWPLPWEVPELTAAGWSPAAGGGATFPWEVTAVFGTARTALTQYEWLLLSSTTVLECLWGAFYASGDRAPLARICDMAAPWAEVTPSMPDAVAAIVSLETPLPAELQLPHGGEGGVSGGSGLGAQGHEACLRAVRAQVSRLALWTLLHHSRRHPREYQQNGMEWSGVMQ